MLVDFRITHVFFTDRGLKLSCYGVLPPSGGMVSVYEIARRSRGLVVVVAMDKVVLDTLRDGISLVLPIEVIIGIFSTVL